MKKRSLSYIVVTLASLGALVACGGGAGGSSASSLPGSNTSSSSGGDAVTVEFWHTFGQKNQEALQKKADDFSKLILDNTGTKVTIDLKYQGGYDEIETKITKGFSAANVPTMAIAYPDHVANYIENEGANTGRYVYDIDSYMSDSKIGFGTQSYLGDGADYGKDDFVQAFLEEGQKFVRSGTYSLPYMKSSEVMFYNKEALAKALTYFKPEITGDDNIAKYIGSISWDEFLELCASVKEHSADISSALETPLWYDSDSNFFISKMYQNNIDYSSIGEDQKGVIDFELGSTRTNAENMVTGIKTAYKDGLLVTKGTEGTYGSDDFKNMKCIFMVGSSGGTGYTMPSAGAFSVGVTRVPVSNDNPQYVSQGPNIVFLKNPAYSEAENNRRMDYAWQFAKYITNPENNVYMCIYGSEGYIPVRNSAYETENFMQFLEEGEIYAKTAEVLLNDIDGHYLNTAVFKGSATLRDQCGGIITSVCKQDTDVTEAFTSAINATKLKM